MMSLIKDDIEIVVINEAAHKYHEKNGTLPQKKNVIDMSPRRKITFLKFRTR